MDVNINVHLHHHDAAEPLWVKWVIALLQTLIQGQVKMNQVVTELQDKTTGVEGAVTKLTGTMTAVVFELKELKTALDNATNAGDVSAVQAVSQRLGSVIDKLNQANDALTVEAEADDPTPDTDIGGNPKVVPVVPLDASYPDNATFVAAVGAYTGPEAVSLDGQPTAKAGITPSLDYFTHSDQGGVVNNVGPTS